MRTDPASPEGHRSPHRRVLLSLLLDFFIHVEMEAASGDDSFITHLFIWSQAG